MGPGRVQETNPHREEGQLTEVNQHWTEGRLMMINALIAADVWSVHEQAPLLSEFPSGRCEQHHSLALTRWHRTANVRANAVDRGNVEPFSLADLVYMSMKDREPQPETKLIEGAPIESKTEQ